VTIDLKLPSNEILHFVGDSVVMTERDKIPGMLRAFKDFSKSPFGVRGQRRYDLSEVMAKQPNILSSPAVHHNSSRLDADTLQMLSNQSNDQVTPDDRKSLRSKRSLSI